MAFDQQFGYECLEVVGSGVGEFADGCGKVMLQADCQCASS